MTTPYIGEIRMFGGTFAPLGWLDCDGSLLAISNYATLYTLIGTTYGGDGQINFALPNLQSRVPVHQGTLAGGQTYPIGSTAGVEAVTLTSQQVPVHTHAIMATTSGQQASPAANAVPASASPSQYNVYGPKASPTTLMPSVGSAGGSGPHVNIQPYMTVRFIIATEGVYPTQG